MNTTAYAPYWQRFAQGMFPMFEDNALAPSTDAHWRVIATLDVLKIENDIFVPTFNEKGRPKIDRERFARAFVAKAVLNIQTTVALIDRLKVDKVLKRSGASVHDSTLSLPLEVKTNSRVTSLYTLADSAYDAQIIRGHINSFGKVEIIDINKRRNLEAPEMTTVEKERYKNRTTAERVNASIKDRFGGRTIIVRGAKKVFCHLMFGILALTAESFLNL